jgi:hypothetical protein
VTQPRLRKVTTMLSPMWLNSVQSSQIRRGWSRQISSKRRLLNPKRLKTVWVGPNNQGPKWKMKKSVQLWACPPSSPRKKKYSSKNNPICQLKTHATSRQLTINQITI